MSRCKMSLLGMVVVACVAFAAGVSMRTDRDGQNDSKRSGELVLSPDDTSATAQFLIQALRQSRDDLDHEAVARAVDFINACGPPYMHGTHEATAAVARRPGANATRGVGHRLNPPQPVADRPVE